MQTSASAYTTGNDASRREGKQVHQQVKKLPLKRRQREQLDLIRSFFYHQTVVVEGGSLTAEARHLPSDQLRQLAHESQVHNNQGELENQDHNQNGPGIANTTRKRPPTGEIPDVQKQEASTTTSPWQVLTQTTTDTYSLLYNQDQKNRHQLPNHLPQKYYQKLVDDSRKILKQHVHKMAEVEEQHQQRPKPPSTTAAPSPQYPLPPPIRTGDVVSPPPPSQTQPAILPTVPTKLTNLPMKRQKKDTTHHSHNTHARPTVRTNDTQRTQQGTAHGGSLEKGASLSSLSNEAQKLLLKQQVAASAKAGYTGHDSAFLPPATNIRKHPPPMMAVSILSPSGQPYVTTTVEGPALANPPHQDNNNNNNNKSTVNHNLENKSKLTGKQGQPMVRDVPRTTKIVPSTLPRASTLPKEPPRHVVESILGRPLTDSSSMRPKCATDHGQAQPTMDTIPAPSGNNNNPKNVSPPVSKKIRFKKVGRPRDKGRKPRGFPRINPLQPTLDRTMDDSNHRRRSLTPPPLLLPPSPALMFANVTQLPATTPYADPNVQYQMISSNDFETATTTTIHQHDDKRPTKLPPPIHTQEATTKPTTTSELATKLMPPPASLPRLHHDTTLVVHSQVPTPNVPGPLAAAHAPSIARPIKTNTASSSSSSSSSSLMLQNETRKHPKLPDPMVSDVKAPLLLAQLSPKSKHASADDDDDMQKAGTRSPVVATPKQSGDSVAASDGMKAGGDFFHSSGTDASSTGVQQNEVTRYEPSEDPGISDKLPTAPLDPPPSTADKDKAEPTPVLDPPASTADTEKAEPATTVLDPPPSTADTEKAEPTPVLDPPPPSTADKDKAEPTPVLDPPPSTADTEKAEPTTVLDPTPPTADTDKAEPTTVLDPPPSTADTDKAEPTAVLDPQPSTADTDKAEPNPGNDETQHMNTNAHLLFHQHEGKLHEAESLVNMLPPEPQKSLLYLKRQLAFLQSTFVHKPLTENSKPSGNKCESHDDDGDDDDDDAHIVKPKAQPPVSQPSKPAEVFDTITQCSPVPELTTTATCSMHVPATETPSNDVSKNELESPVNLCSIPDHGALVAPGEIPTPDEAPGAGSAHRSAPRFKKQPRSNRSATGATVVQAKSVTADSVASSDVSVSSPVASFPYSQRRQSTAGAQYCHACKKKSLEYRRCSYWVWSKCGKRFCRKCLEDEYGQTEDWYSLLSDKDWHCPSCLKTCKCGPCLKLRSRETAEPLRKSRRERSNI